MAFQLVLFGSPRLADATGAAVAFPTKGLLLAGHLLLSHEGYLAPRARLAQCLWDSAESQTASTNLRQLLARVRNRQTELGLDLLHGDANYVRLDPATVSIDVVRLQRLIANAEDADLDELCRLYSGDFLADVDPEGEAARAWVDAHRTRLRNLFVETVSRRIETANTRDRLSQIKAAAQKLLEVDPYQEAGYRALMRAAAMERQLNRVRELFNACQTRLRSDLDAVPDTATLDLVRELLPGQARTSQVAALRPVADPAPHNAAPGRATGGTPRLTIMLPGGTTETGGIAELATSLIEDVTINLCALRSLSLIAPHTAWRIGQAEAPAHLVQQFGIDYVAESRLVSQPDGATLFVKLLRSRSREFVWADRFELTELTAAHRYRELVRRIAASVVDQIERVELQRFDSEQDPTAYHHYLVGRRDLAVMDLPRIRRARKSFRLALKACPDFVPALAGMARSFQREWLLLARDDKALLGEAEHHAVRAMTLAPDDARGHREFGVCSLFAGRFDDGVAALRRAEAASPHYADVVADLADTLVHASQPELGLAKIERAIDLNPLCPDDYWWTAAGANYHLERYDEALSSLAKMADRTPAFRLMAMTWAMKGDQIQARFFMRKTKEIHPDFRVNAWLSTMPFREQWQRHHYEMGLRKAGFD